MSGYARLSKSVFSVFALLAIVGAILVAVAPAASAYSICAPGQNCDGPGQQCMYFLPNSPRNCHTILTCLAYSRLETVRVPVEQTTFCMRDITTVKVEDLSLAGQGATAYFKFHVRDGVVINYIEEVQNITEYFFNAGGNLVCDPAPTPTPCPTQCCMPICPPPRPPRPPRPIDPPVDCTFTLTGPGLERTVIGTDHFDTLPNAEYDGVVRIPQSYFTQPGVYSVDVSCTIDLPENTTEGFPGCTTASARLNFHVETCNTAISIETDKSSYVSGEMLTARGSLRNNNIPVSGNVEIRLKDTSGSTVASFLATSNNGEYSTNYLLPSTFAAGTYAVEASGHYNVCADVSSTVHIGYVPCGVTVSSQFNRQGSGAPLAVSGSVLNFGAPAAGANITVKVYSGGNLVRQAYSGTMSDGSYSIPISAIGAGTYTAQVEARYLSCAVATQTATINAPCDIRADVVLSSRTVTSGQALIVSGTISDAYGNPLAGTYDISLRSRTSGAVVATSSAATLSGSFFIVFFDIPSGDYEVLVVSQSGGCTATNRGNIFSSKNYFDVSLFSSPRCGTTQTGYQFKIKNNLNASTTVMISYSSIDQIRLIGPTSIYLSPSEEKVFNVDAVISEGFNGGSIGAIYFTNGNTAATLNVELPICAVGNLKLTAIDKIRYGSPGQEVCYSLMLENKGPESGTATLSYGSGAYSMEGRFNFPQLRLSSYETRNDIVFCTKVPNVYFNTIPISLHASAPFGQSTDYVSLSTGSSSGLVVQFYGCPYLARGVQFPITVFNKGDTADYSVEISDNGFLHPQVVPSKLYGFSKYSNQIITVTANPTGLLAANYVSLILRKDGVVVSQQQICFSTLLAPTPVPTPIVLPGCRYHNPDCPVGYYCDTVVNVCKEKTYASSLTVIDRGVLGEIDQPVPIGPGSVPTNTAKLAIVAYAPILEYGYNGTDFIANASFLVQNNENTDQSLSVMVGLLPAGWAISYEPRTQTVKPGEIKEYLVRIVAKDFETKAYTGIFSVSDASGRVSQSQFTVDASNVRKDGGLLTGFFSGALSGTFLVGTLLLAIGAILLYGIQKNSEALSRLETG